MTNLYFGIALTGIMVPLMLVIVGLSPKAEKGLDKAEHHISKALDKAIPWLVIALDIFIFIGLIGLSLGKYGFKVLK